MKRLTGTIRFGASRIWGGFWTIVGVATGVDEPEPAPPPQIYPKQD